MCSSKHICSCITKEIESLFILAIFGDMETQHVLMMPFPIQGHIKPMLCLAELLSHAGLHVTYVNTHHNHRRLNNVLKDLSTRYATLCFESISDGLPEDHPRVGSQHLVELCESIKNVTMSLFLDLLGRTSQSDAPRPPVSCVISDGSLGIDAAVELRIKVIVFKTLSASCSWVYFCLPKLIQDREIPFPDKYMDKPVTCIPSLENVLRRRDLPRICRLEKADDPAIQLTIDDTLALPRASALIINTFDGLEAPMISKLGSFFSKIYTVGPLQALLSSIVKDSPPLASTNGLLWKEDRECMSWLDSQSLRSVVFVSFGSLVQLTLRQMLEFWHGLINSGNKFLWVIRSDSITGEDDPGRILKELEDKAHGGARIMVWAPQEEVLAHPAIGGFLTHGGWNSTLESIYAGVPMICWPAIGDQLVNSRYVSHVWKIGFDMKDTCDRSTVEKMVRDLTVNKREEIMKSMDEMTKTAHDNTKEGGSSYCKFHELIQDIKSIGSLAGNENVQEISKICNFK